MPNESNLWLPSHLRGGQKRIKVVFYKWKLPGDTYRYTNGFPDQFPAPPGAEKIVCETAADVDKYDKILRDQQKAEAEMNAAERYAKEEPHWKYLRSQMQQNYANAKDAVNREFCRLALLEMDKMEEKRKEVVESFQHICGYEDGK